jgi:tryptophan synthase alpha chain
LPVAVGFGIKTPERAAEVARVADAAVVGSALVDEIAGALEGGSSPVVKVLDKAARLAEAVRSARVVAAEA